MFFDFLFYLPRVLCHIKLRFCMTFLTFDFFWKYFFQHPILCFKNKIHSLILEKCIPLNCPWPSALNSVYWGVENHDIILLSSSNWRHLCARTLSAVIETTCSSSIPLSVNFIVGQWITCFSILIILGLLSVPSFWMRVGEFAQKISSWRFTFPLLIIVTVSEHMRHTLVLNCCVGRMKIRVCPFLVEGSALAVHIPQTLTFYDGKAMRWCIYIRI